MNGWQFTWSREKTAPMKLDIQITPQNKRHIGSLSSKIIGNILLHVFLCFEDMVFLLSHTIKVNYTSKFFIGKLSVVWENTNNV